MYFLEKLQSSVAIFDDLGPLTAIISIISIISRL